MHDFDEGLIPSCCKALVGEPGRHAPPIDASWFYPPHIGDVETVVPTDGSVLHVTRLAIYAWINHEGKSDICIEVSLGDSWVVALDPRSMTRESELRLMPILFFTGTGFADHATNHVEVNPRCMGPVRVYASTTSCGTAEDTFVNREWSKISRLVHDRINHLGRVLTAAHMGWSRGSPKRPRVDPVPDTTVPWPPPPAPEGVSPMLPSVKQMLPPPLRIAEAMRDDAAEARATSVDVEAVQAKTITDQEKTIMRLTTQIGELGAKNSAALALLKRENTEAINRADTERHGLILRVDELQTKVAGLEKQRDDATARAARAVSALESHKATANKRYKALYELHQAQEKNLQRHQSSALKYQMTISDLRDKQPTTGAGDPDLAHANLHLRTLNEKLKAENTRLRTAVVKIGDPKKMLEARLIAIRDRIPILEERNAALEAKTTRLEASVVSFESANATLRATIAKGPTAMVDELKETIKGLRRELASVKSANGGLKRVNGVLRRKQEQKDAHAAETTRLKEPAGAAVAVATDPVKEAKACLMFVSRGLEKPNSKKLHTLVQMYPGTTPLAVALTAGLGIPPTQRHDYITEHLSPMIMSWVGRCPQDGKTLDVGTILRVAFKTDKPMVYEWYKAYLMHRNMDGTWTLFFPDDNTTLMGFSTSKTAFYTKNPPLKEYQWDFYVAEA